MRLVRRAPIVGALTVGALIVGIAASGRAQAPTAPATARAAADRRTSAPGAATAEMVIVRVGRYSGGSVMALRTDSALLVSVRPFLQLIGLRLHQHETHLVGQILQVGTMVGAPIDVDPATRTVRVGSRTVVAEARELIVQDGTVYVDQSVLARAFALQLRYDTDDGVLVVEDAAALPIALWREHADARAAVIAAASRRDGDTHGAAADHRERPSFGAVMDYVVTHSGGLVPGMQLGGDAKGATTASVGLAVGAPHGVFSTRLARDGVVGAGGGVAELAWTWERAGRLLRTLRVGSSQSAGLRPIAVRGLMLSNASLTRDQATAATTLGGAIPNGWLVEAYRAGSLVAADTTGSGDGVWSDPTALVDERLAPGGTRRFGLSIPVHAGQTAVDVVAVGPEGQMQVVQRLIHVMPLELPARTFEYRIVGGSCDPRDLPTGATEATCRGRMSADLRYAITARWAVRGGVDRTWLTTAGDGGAQPYVALAATPWNALSLTAEHSPNQLEHFAARFQPNMALLVSADRTTARDAWVPKRAIDGSSVELSTMTSVSAAWQRSSVSQSRFELLLAPRVFHGLALEAHDVRTVFSGGTWEQQQVGAVVPIGLADVRSYVRREITAPVPGATLIGSSATILPTGALARLLGRTWVTTVGEVGRDGRPARAELTVARPLGGFWRSDVSAFWDRRTAGYRATVSLTSQLPAVRTASQTSLGANGGGGFTTHTVSGSAVWDPSAHAVVLGGESGFDRGGIAGRVFLDVNGNGRRDPGEPGIPGAVLQLATRTVTADADGRYRVLGLSPETVVHIVLDSSSLSSPWWAPAVSDLDVRPSGGRIASVDVPVVIGGVVNGRVVVDGGGRGTHVPGGTQVILRDLARGRVYRADVFTDGAFSASGLPPGRFEARVDLRALLGGWDGDSAVVEIDVPHVAAKASALDAVGPIVDNVQLALRRVRSAVPVTRAPSSAVPAPDALGDTVSMPAPVVRLEGLTRAAPVLGAPAVVLAGAPAHEAPLRLTLPQASPAGAAGPGGSPAPERAACTPRAAAIVRVHAAPRAARGWRGQSRPRRHHARHHTRRHGHRRHLRRHHTRHHARRHVLRHRAPVGRPSVPDVRASAERPLCDLP